jgi:hypothetical protein
MDVAQHHSIGLEKPGTAALHLVIRQKTVQRKQKPIMYNK